MEFWKKPLLRVPLVLAGTGIVCRSLTFLLAFSWGRIQIARGPDPVTGAYELSTGYVTEIVSVAAFLLFWLAGWHFARGLERRQIFFSATIMVVWQAVLLVWEQISQAMGGYSWLVHYLYATTESTMWASQLLFRLFDQVSLPLAVPALFTPYLYILLGKSKAAP